MEHIVVYRGRTKRLQLEMPYDISQDTIRSQIRRGQRTSTPLIAEWEVEFETDGKNGSVILTLDDSVTAAITDKIGYMDIKRVSGDEPIPVGEKIQVIFKDTITE